MIQIARRQTWEKAAERLRTEPQSVRRHEAGLWLVTNKIKNHTYAVRVEQMHGKTFITCGCEAGSPTKGNRFPIACKHAAAVIILLRAVREMRRTASH